MNSLKTKDFHYRVTINGLTYTLENVVAIFGIYLQMDLLVRTKVKNLEELNECDKKYWDYLKEKKQRYETMSKSVKFLNE